MNGVGLTGLAMRKDFASGSIILNQIRTLERAQALVSFEPEVYVT